MTTETNSSAEMRLRENKHFASLLRRRLEARHGNGALRERLAQMSDSELIDAYLNNEQQGRDHLAKTQTQKQADKMNHLMRRAEKEVS
jgi:hypothetical protein